MKYFPYKKFFDQNQANQQELQGDSTVSIYQKGEMAFK